MNMFYPICSRISSITIRRVQIAAVFNKAAKIEWNILQKSAFFSPAEKIFYKSYIYILDLEDNEPVLPFDSWGVIFLLRLFE